MSIYKPENYHGFKKTKNFFEGWYYKLVNSDKTFSIAFIPGVSITNEQNRHSFIQIISSSNFSKNIKYNFSDFYSERDKFFVKINENSFTEDNIKVNIKKENINIKGYININKKIKWPVKLISPGAMGPFSFIPSMECNHGIININGLIDGTLGINGEDICFNGGKCYIEKDWGKSFPSSWIWMQSNCFPTNDASITLSIARIPFMGKHFKGFIGGLYLKNKLYRFATYNFSKIQNIKYLEDHVEVTIKKKKLILKIKAYRSIGSELFSPEMGSMKGRINESLNALLDVELIKENEVIFKEAGTNSGLEIIGKL